MKRLTILKHRRPEDRHLAELQHLLVRLRVEAARVFGEVEVRVQDEGEAGGELPRDGAVLLLGSGQILLTAPSFEVMAEALAAGARAVYPAPLSRFDRPSGSPVYTLRGYLAAEAEILQGGLEPREVPGSHLPVSLFRADHLRDLAGARPVASLLTDPAALVAPTPGQPPAHAGTYHAFIDYYGETREDVLPFVPPQAREVLEVGCGRGGTAELLQRHLGCRVTGVELNPEVARVAAQRMHRVLAGDVEELGIDGSYDAVLALEVIEHLVDPPGFLHRMAALTRPGGRIVLSTPNVGHFAVVEDLLAGRWDYIPGGVLCSTHIRFFTRPTLEDLLAGCGFKRFAIHPQKTGLPASVAAFARDRGGDLESLAANAFIVTIDL